MLQEIHRNTQKLVPLVHNITNYVTANDCANITLACGGSPIMADDILEVEEVTAMSNALVINTGTLNERTVKAMFVAGRKANELELPVILDPVGVGATRLRSDTIMNLMKEVYFSVIRGNSSEIRAITGNGNTRGVDASLKEQITDVTVDEAIELAKWTSKRTGAVIVITGRIDLIADHDKVCLIRNGHPMMSRVTGTGCMLTSMIGSFCGANPDKLYEACISAVCAMGMAGEYAYEKIMERNEGTASYRQYIIDFISKMDDLLIEKGAKLEMR